MEKSGKRFDKKLILGFIIGIIIGAGAAYIVFSAQVSRVDVENNVKKFYELVYPENQIEVVSIKEESGLYKVFVKITPPGGTPSYQEAYVSKDGKLLTQAESTVIIENSIQLIERTKNFVNCLYERDVRIYGVLDQGAVPEGAQATSLQLNILGRLYSPRLLISCDGQIQQCLDSGITQVPSTVVNSTIEPGIKTIDWFESRTGCKL